MNSFWVTGPLSKDMQKFCTLCFLGFLVLFFFLHFWALLTFKVKGLYIYEKMMLTQENPNRRWAWQQNAESVLTSNLCHMVKCPCVAESIPKMTPSYMKLLLLCYWFKSTYFWIYSRSKLVADDKTRFWI